MRTATTLSPSVTIVRQAYDAFARGDIATIVNLLSDDVAWTCPRTLAQGGEFSGKDGVMSFFGKLSVEWDSLSLDIRGVGELADGLVAGVVRGSGVCNGELASYGAVHVFSVANGQISRFDEYTDLDEALV